MDLTNLSSRHSVDTGPPAADTFVNIYKERLPIASSADAHDGVGLNSPERSRHDAVAIEARKQPLNVGTWNV